MKKTAFRRHALLIPLILVFTMISCKRNCDFCADCQNSFASDAKIKKITAHHGAALTTVIEFSYDKNLVDSIHQTVFTDNVPTRVDYKLFYDHCVLTGFQSTEVDPGVIYTVDAGFVVDSDKVTKEIQVRYSNQPFGNNVLNAKYEYTVNADGTIPIRFKRCLNCLRSGTRNKAHYNAEKNVDTFLTTTDIPDYTSVNGPWDNKVNPFSRQNNLLYYFNLLPFNYAVPTHLSDSDDRFDFIELSRNNPLEINQQFILAGDTFIFFLEYTYDGSNRPISIKIKESDELGNINRTPPTLVGQLDLEYF
jgi:hypothetical protein